MRKHARRRGIRTGLKTPGVPSACFAIFFAGLTHIKRSSRTFSSQGFDRSARLELAARRALGMRWHLSHVGFTLINEAHNDTRVSVPFRIIASAGSILVQCMGAAERYCSV